MESGNAEEMVEAMEALVALGDREDMQFINLLTYNQASQKLMPRGRAR